MSDLDLSLVADLRLNLDSTELLGRISRMDIALVHLKQALASLKEVGDFDPYELNELIEETERALEYHQAALL